MTRVRIGHNAGQGFVEDEVLSPSQAGYEFQFRLTELIIDRLKGFKTVTLRTMDGGIITQEDFRRRGPDGGLDLITEIEARTEAATKAIASRVRTILAGIR